MRGEVSIYVTLFHRGQNLLGQTKQSSMAYCNTAYPGAGKFLKRYSHISNTIQDLRAIVRYWGFDLAVTLAGIASGFWVRF